MELVYSAIKYDIPKAGSVTFLIKFYDPVFEEVKTLTSIIFTDRDSFDTFVVGIMKQWKRCPIPKVFNDY